MNWRSRWSRRRFASETRRRSSMALRRRWACQTIARNMAPISGTSVSSSASCAWWTTSWRSNAPVDSTTAVSSPAVTRGPHTRKPYRMVRLTQMKWNGTVSHSGTSAMATRLASAKPTQARSSQKRRSGQPNRSVRGDSIPLTSHGRDRVGAQLGPEPAHVDVDHVGAGIEVVVPDRRQKPLLGDGRAGVLHELAQQQELAFSQRDRPGAAVGLPPDQIQPQAAGDQTGGGAAGGGPQPGPDPGQQLVEGERLSEVVLGPRFQASDLGRGGGQAGQDEHGLGRTLGHQPAQHRGAVHPRHEQVEDDQVVTTLERLVETVGTVVGRIDQEALGLQPSHHEPEDPRFVVDDQNPAGKRRSRALVGFSQHGQLLAASVWRATAGGPGPPRWHDNSVILGATDSTGSLEQLPRRVNGLRRRADSGEAWPLQQRQAEERERFEVTPVERHQGKPVRGRTCRDPQVVVRDGLANRFRASTQVPILGRGVVVGEWDDVEHLLVEREHARGPRRSPFALAGAVVRLAQGDQADG